MIHFRPISTSSVGNSWLYPKTCLVADFPHGHIFWQASCLEVKVFIFIRIYFLRILTLKLPKFEENVKNGNEARTFFRVDFCMLKIYKIKSRSKCKASCSFFETAKLTSWTRKQYWLNVAVWSQYNTDDTRLDNKECIFDTPLHY